jgi:hypothetical protein
VARRRYRKTAGFSSVSTTRSGTTWSVITTERWAVCLQESAPVSVVPAHSRGNGGVIGRAQLQLLTGACPR